MSNKRLNEEGGEEEAISEKGDMKNEDLQMDKQKPERYHLLFL